MKENNHSNAELLDVSFSENNTVASFHGPSEHGGVFTRVAMYDDDNRPAPMNRATHGVLTCSIFA